MSSAAARRAQSAGWRSGRWSARALQATLLILVVAGPARADSGAGPSVVGPRVALSAVHFDSKSSTTRIEIDGQAFGLLPGSEFSIEMKAEYVVYDPSGFDRPHKDGVPLSHEVRQRVASADVLKWDLVVRREAEIFGQEIEFRFAGELPPPMNGTVAAFFFPYRLKASLPPRNGQLPGTTTRERTLGVPGKQALDPTQRLCLKLRGFPDGLFGFGLNDCAAMLERPHPAARP